VTTGPFQAIAAALRDARWFQIAGQTTILAIGILARDFQIAALAIATAGLCCLGAQWLGSALNAIRFDWKSAAISALSLTLLLRSNELWPIALAAAIAIGSKFTLRLHGAHVFNPANIGLVATLLITDAAWTSTGEWGTAPWFAVTIAGLGAIVCWRASRLDVPAIFLATFAALVLGRALYLGDPIAIPMLRLQSAELYLFAFFMISDPKTTPENPRLRAAFVIATAALSYVLIFHFFNADGLFYAAFAAGCARAVALALRPPGARYNWGAPPAPIGLRLATGRRRAPAPAE
jgi:Na+-transporting NADH:ubiquinone oxidoreductase subunit NqrB